jgi:hypothetical protein
VRLSQPRMRRTATTAETKKRSRNLDESTWRAGKACRGKGGGGM